MRLMDDKDIAAVSAALSQIIKDGIGQAANILVPAIANASIGALSGITVKVGPITIDPITIRIAVDDSSNAMT